MGNPPDDFQREYNAKFRAVSQVEVCRDDFKKLEVRASARTLSVPDCGL